MKKKTVTKKSTRQIVRRFTLDEKVSQVLSETKAMFLVMQDHLQYMEDIIITIAQLRSAPHITIQPPPKRMGQ